MNPDLPPPTAPGMDLPCDAAPHVDARRSDRRPRSGALPVLAMAIAALAASACSVEMSNTGGDPTDLVDWDDVQAQARKAAGAAAEQLLQPLQAYRIDQGHGVYQQVVDAFDSAAEARRLLMLRAPAVGGFHDVTGKVRSLVRTDRPKFAVIGIDDPVSITFADGTILVSRRLVDGLAQPDSDESRWMLRAIAAHELAHFRDGHALFNWLATGGQQQSNVRSALSGLSRLTSLIPLASFSYDYAPGAAFSNLAKQPAIFEFLADYWAFYTLKEMGAPPRVLPATLARVEAAGAPAAKPARQLSVDRLIGLRAKCASLLDADDAVLAGVTTTNAGVMGFLRGDAPVVGHSDEQNAALALIGQLSSEARQSRRDELYWSCALWALVPPENPDGKEFNALLTGTSLDAFPSAYRGFALGPHKGQPSGQAIYVPAIDGIDLLEAGTAYAKPRVDERPLLKLEQVRYDGWADGRHRILLTARNSGLSPTPGALAVTARHNGGDMPANVCADSPVGPCRPFNDGAPLAPRRAVPAVLWVTGPRTDEFTSTPLTLVAEACGGEPGSGTGCGKDAERLTARAEVKMDLRAYLSFYASASGTLRALPRPASDFSLWLSNRGWSPTTKPVYLHAFKDGKPVRISSCAMGFEGASGPCVPYVLPKALAPGENLKLEVWVVDAPDRAALSSEFQFVISGCEVLANARGPASGGERCSGELRDGLDNKRGG